jgi:hypothetical protein
MTGMASRAQPDMLGLSIGVIRLGPSESGRTTDEEQPHPNATVKGARMCLVWRPNKKDSETVFLIFTTERLEIIHGGQANNFGVLDPSIH